jgi:hypothetical protein
MQIESRLTELGLVLPPPLIVPPTIRVPFKWVHVHGSRAFVPGHAPQKPDGTLFEPRRKVGLDLSEEEAYLAARAAGLSILSSLKRGLGDFDRVIEWLKITGYINCAPGFNRLTNVLNGFSDLIIALYGEGAGAHSRSAIGVAELVLDSPVIIDAEVAIAA